MLFSCLSLRLKTGSDRHPARACDSCQAGGALINFSPHLNQKNKLREMVGMRESGAVVVLVCIVQPQKFGKKRKGACHPPSRAERSARLGGWLHESRFPALLLAKSQTKSRKKQQKCHLIGYFHCRSGVPEHSQMLSAMPATRVLSWRSFPRCHRTGGDSSDPRSSKRGRKTSW